MSSRNVYRHRALNNEKNHVIYSSLNLNSAALVKLARTFITLELHYMFYVTRRRRRRRRIPKKKIKKRAAWLPLRSRNSGLFSLFWDFHWKILVFSAVFFFFLFYLFYLIKFRPNLLLPRPEKPRALVNQVQQYTAQFVQLFVKFSNARCTRAGSINNVNLSRKHVCLKPYA